VKFYKYTVSQKKCATLFVKIILSALNHFQNSFTAEKSANFATKQLQHYPPHPKYERTTSRNCDIRITSLHINAVFVSMFFCD